MGETILPLNDIYRALQARLDSYRQSATAFTGAAFVLITVFDAAIFRGIDTVAWWFFAVAAIMIGFIGLQVHRVLLSIEDRFLEMTEVIVRIERSGGYHSDPFDSQGTLLPTKWNQPWVDFAVILCRQTLKAVTVLHILLMMTLLYFQVRG